MSSGGMYAAGLTVDDLQMTDADYRGSEQYARAKRAQVTLNEMWARRVDRTAVVFHALHPGWADTPGVEASLPQFRRVMRPLLRTPAEGADTLVWLAADDGEPRANQRRLLARPQASQDPSTAIDAPFRHATTPPRVVGLVRRPNRGAHPVMTDLTRRRRIAVIGSGISGLACAHVLGPHHDVVLFEADRRLGGHSNTVDVDDPVAGHLAVDTGFIVHNDRNYPNLVRLFGELGCRHGRHRDELCGHRSRPCVDRLSGSPIGRPTSTLCSPIVATWRTRRCGRCWRRSAASTDEPTSSSTTPTRRSRSTTSSLPTGSHATSSSCTFGRWVPRCGRPTRRPSVSFRRSPCSRS